MQYVVVTSKTALEDAQIDKIKSTFNLNQSILTDSIDGSWLSKNKRIFVIYKYPNIEIYNKYKSVNVTDNAICLINGWIKKNDEDNLLTADKIAENNVYSKNEYDGYYSILNINNSGNGFLTRSIASPITYFSEDNELQVISNRVSICAEITNNTTISKSYMANHILVGNRPFTDESMYENVTRLFGNLSININDSEITFKENSYDVLYDKKLENLYNKSKDKYWDLCVKRLKSQATAFNKLGLNLELGITGGKDSRLNLAVYKDYITKTFSWGPIYQTDVYIGRLMSQLIGKQHDLREPSVIKDNYLDNLTKHLFYTEFNKCAYDTNLPEDKNYNDVYIDGQEYGVRKELVFSPTDKKIFKLFNNKRKNILNDNLFNKIKEKREFYTSKILKDIKDKHKFKYIENYFSRGETWVGAVIEEAMVNKFSIYTLCTNTVSLFCYNISLDAIVKEELHYECVKRLAPEFLDIPLNGQKYFQHKVEPIIEIINFDKFRLPNLSIVSNFDKIEPMLLNDLSSIDNFINTEELKKYIDNNDISKPQTLQLIYNLIQAIVMNNNTFFANLKNNKFKHNYKNTTSNFDNDENIFNLINYYENRKGAVNKNIKNIISYTVYNILNTLTLNKIGGLQKKKFKYIVRI